MAQDSLLGGCRVLDLADEKGLLCGRLLADMGADVIKIEPPAGDAARRIGPFWRDQADSQRSLFWFAYAAGRRGISLNLESRDGRAIFRRLAQSADFVIESFDPGHLDSLELGYEVLQRLNGRLILVSVTHFGQAGPYAAYQGSDLVGMAMGGFMYVNGDPEKPPVTISFPQAYLHAGAEAAAGAMLAHFHREGTGVGQQVDVSIQEAVTWTLMNAAPTWDMNRVNPQRSGPVRRRAEGVVRAHWPCKDGYVTFLGGAQWGAMGAWMEAEGFPIDECWRRDWTAIGPGSVPQAEVERLTEQAAAFFQTQRVWDVYDEAARRRIMLYPVATVADLLEYRHLKERGFFIQVDHPELGKRLAYPGPFARTTEAQPRLHRRAPLLGEHNLELYQGELALSLQELGILKANGVF